MRRRALGGDGNGAARGFEWRGRGEWTRMRRVSEPAGAWRHRVRDGLMSGGNTGVQPPLGMLGLTTVSHDGLNSKAIRASIK